MKLSPARNQVRAAGLDPQRSAACPASRRPPARQAGFTMVEIALCLAIIGFALVAIIGVLPTGLNVQRENREETLISQDANYFIEAIRSGAQGADELMKHVESIRVNNTQWLPGTGAQRYRNARQIISLLSTPKYLPFVVGNSNIVEADVRAISGVVAEQPNANEPTDLAFRYHLTSELIPFGSFYWDTNEVDVSRAATNVVNNLYELRLTFRWPLPPNPNTTNVNYTGRQVFRTLISGQLEPDGVGFRFQPQVYRP